MIFRLEERRSLHLQVLKACIEVKPESSYSDDQNKQVSHDNVKTGLAGSDKQSGRNTNSGECFKQLTNLGREIFELYNAKLLLEKKTLETVVDFSEKNSI